MAPKRLTRRVPFDHGSRDPFPAPAELIPSIAPAEPVTADMVIAARDRYAELERCWRRDQGRGR